MSAHQTWSEGAPEPKMKSCLSTEWTFDAPIAVPKTPDGRSDSESFINKYKDLLKTASNDSVTKANNPGFDHPFDAFDENEFLFGTNLVHKNIAFVGEYEITKLMELAQEPWPDNVKLFQPYEVEQILLPDNASCLAVQAFLKMCHLPFEVEMRWNAEFMSPSGRVPFIKCGAFVVSELEPIVQFCGNKGATLSARLSTEERAEMRAYMSLITNVLLNAELYISWMDNETYNNVTRARNASVYPWPLGWLQTRAKRNAVTKRLRALNWHDKTLDRVLSDVEQCCNSLSQRLGEKDYFFDTPTPVDALICGHVRALLSAEGPKAHLMIRPITRAMLRLTYRVANMTDMKLEPREQFLMSQALIIPPCVRPVSPQRTASSYKSGRFERVARRTQMPFKARDRLCKGDSVFGFRPFVAKQVVVMKSQDGRLFYESNVDVDKALDKTDLEIENANGAEKNSIVEEIVEDILKKVEDLTSDSEVDGYFDANNNERDVYLADKEFEIIAECNENNEDLLREIEKSDIKENTEDSCEDQTSLAEDNIDTDFFSATTLDTSVDMFDGDGIENDKHLESITNEVLNGCGPWTTVQIVEKSETI